MQTLWKGKEMIKVAIYENSWNFEDDEPSEILTLKEFEKEYNGRFDEDIMFDPSKIKFIVG